MYFRFNCMPATAQTLALYAQFLARTFKSPQSIRNYLSGVKLMHILADVQCTDFNSVELKLVVKGIARQKMHTPNKALPMTPQLLLNIKAMLDTSQPYQAVFWCLSVLAFFTMSRKSNLVPNSISTFDHRKQWLRKDLLLKDDCMIIRVKWSKTNQFSDRALYIPLVAMPESQLCPVAAYINMVNIVPPNGDKNQPAFCVIKSEKVVAFTYIQLHKMLRECIKRLGLDPMAYSSHSYRRGGATTAFRAQVPGELIQLQGDWASDAYKQYLQFSIKDRAFVASKL